MAAAAAIESTRVSECEDGGRDLKIDDFSCENSRSMNFVFEKCDKCGLKIADKEMPSHIDMHIAEDLDKELNPNKRKYKKVAEDDKEIDEAKK